jgi:hypothetical protein
VKRVGRPAKGLKCQISLFLTASAYRAVAQYATEEKIIFSEAVRRLIDMGLDARKKIKEKKEK